MDSTIGIIPAMTNGCCDNDNYTNFLDCGLVNSFRSILGSNVMILYIMHNNTYVACLAKHKIFMYKLLALSSKNRFHLPQV